MGIYNDRLGWKIDERYELLNEAVSHAWNWGSGLEVPQSISALKRMLALDPNFEVLISHGLTDVQTRRHSGTRSCRLIKFLTMAHQGG